MKQFDFIASTGRTATTFIATTLNLLPDVLASHEGYAGNNKSADPALPLINLENAQAYAAPDSSYKIVMDKRSVQQIDFAAEQASAQRVIDVAYYNSMISKALLKTHPSARMVGIIRNCANFVRSSTTITGEDPLPVGWPDKGKQLTDKERFIGMGRIRPQKQSPDRPFWRNWSAIRKNLWLWEQTNQMICDTKIQYPDRVILVRFETLVEYPDSFWSRIEDFLELPSIGADNEVTSKKAINKKPFNYQVGPPETWSESEQTALYDFQDAIDRRAQYDC